MKTIPLTQGLITLVDDDKYPELSKHKWYAQKGGRQWRAARGFFDANGKHRLIYMHCVILGTRPGLEIDHITHEGEEDGVIDNRRENLRFCTRAQNCANQRKPAGCSSQFKGATKRDQGWDSFIYANGKVKYLGHFKTEEEAAYAYDEAARGIRGEHARLNFPYVPDWQI